MAMAAARVGAQPPVVKCRICGRPSLRGSKLCDECVAAVKRARHVNTLTSEFVPQAGPRRSSPVRAVRDSTRSPSTRWSWMPTKPAAWGVLVAFTVFGAAVVGTAFLAVQEISDRSPKGRIPPSASEPSAARPNILPQAPDATSATGAPATLRAATERLAAAPVEAPHAEASAPVVESLQVTPLPEKHPPRKAAMETRKKPSPRAVPAQTDSGGESKATIAAPEPAEVAPPPAAAPAPAPRAPDRWETMNAALAACSQETLLAGVMCTERVRYQFCEGFWGQVSQCRAATRPGLSR